MKILKILQNLKLYSSIGNYDQYDVMVFIRLGILLDLS